MATLPNEFFTPQSMLTLTGATGIVFVVTNGLKAAFDFSPRWIGLAIGEVISLLGVGLSGGQGLDYFVGVINGFLIFSAAAGVSSAGGPKDAAISRGGVGNADDARRGLPPRRRFWSAWF
jgi:hypothetical protein